MSASVAVANPTLTVKQRLLHKEKYLLLVIMSVSYFLGTTLFACIVPFFPTIAASRNISEAEIGFIFGIMQLTIFLLSPLYGRYMDRLGAKFLFCTGVFVTGYSALLFGLLDMCPTSSFTALAILIRMFTGIGNAAYMTAAFAIAAYRFQKRAATVIAFLEVFSGLGYVIGPPIGGLMYKYGGYIMPFLTFGITLLSFSFISACLKTMDNIRLPKTKAPNCTKLLTEPNILFALFSIFFTFATITFFDPTLAPHVADMKLSPEVIGFIFTVPSISYSIVCPLVGCIIDKRPTITLHLMAIGYLFSGLPILLMGPSPFIPLKKSLTWICIGFGIHGIGLGTITVTSFNHCLSSVLRQGHPNTFNTYALVSGFYTSAISLGSFAGPTIGGLAVNRFNFEPTSAFLALFNAALAVVPVLLLLACKPGAPRPAPSKGAQLAVISTNANTQQQPIVVRL